MKNKKGMKIIIAIVAAAMIISTFASIFVGGGRDTSSGKTVEVNEDNLNENGSSQQVATEITDSLKEAMNNAKVEAGDKDVKATITVSEDVSAIQADKMTEEYANQLKEKYKGKNISVQVIHGKETVSSLNNYAGIASSDASIPKADIQISSGLTLMDRYVAVTLDTDKPQEYDVEVSGQKLEYVPSRNYFDGLIESTDEAAITKSLKITKKAK